MKYINLALVAAIGYIIHEKGVPFNIELPKEYVYIEKITPVAQCPKIPKEFFSIETLEQTFCKGDLETVLMKEVKQVKVDLEEKFATY